MPAGDYPISGRVGTAASIEFNALGDPDRSFRFGLDCVLDGLERLLQRRADRGAKPATSRVRAGATLFGVAISGDGLRIRAAAVAVECRPDDR